MATLASCSCVGVACCLPACCSSWLPPTLLAPIGAARCSNGDAAHGCRVPVHLLHHQDLRRPGVRHHHDHQAASFHLHVQHDFREGNVRGPMVGLPSPSRGAPLPVAPGNALKGCPLPMLPTDAPLMQWLPHRCPTAAPSMTLCRLHAACSADALTRPQQRWAADAPQIPHSCTTHTPPTQPCATHAPPMHHQCTTHASRMPHPMRHPCATHAPPMHHRCRTTARNVQPCCTLHRAAW
jgi:hypothetical protein